MVREWRRSRGLPEDPLLAIVESGYVDKITAERGSKNMKTVTSYA
jgi:L-rhamnose isomerase/sugar isomerase